MSDLIPETPTSKEVWRTLMQENRKLREENGKLWEAVNRLTAEREKIENLKKLWLKRAGWAFVLICVWLTWEARNIPWDWGEGAPGAGGN